MFICNQCPFVIHVIDEIVMIANDYRVQGIGIVAISSNDIINYPQDAPDKMADFALENKIEFPYLYDETQEVAKAYNAACTPDLYVFDSDLKSIYHGQLDDSRPGNGVPVSGKDIRRVLETMLSNRIYKGVPKPSMGCNIKWK